MMFALYSILCPPETGIVGRRAECKEPELVVEGALLDTVLADPITASLLTALGLTVDAGLAKSREQDREVSATIMSGLMKKARNSNQRGMMVQHACQVAAELGLVIEKPGAIQRLRDAIQ